MADRRALTAEPIRGDLRRQETAMSRALNLLVKILKGSPNRIDFYIGLAVIAYLLSQAVEYQREKRYNQCGSAIYPCAVTIQHQ